MADVFVSYAKADRSLASKLVAMLEAEGWSVWWDTSLVIGDDFRNEIMTELGRARAAIVMWTDASIKSDWVRSEAGRAQADRKLIPVKLEHLTYKDLPPPFDVLHTENVGEDDKIRAAVVAQLAKPAVEPSAWALLAKGFKYEVLTWFGIVGGALTLFTNLSATLQLAKWARILVEHWREWTHAFWLWAFGWLGIHLPPEWAPVLSFVLFWLLLTIGEAVKFRITTNSQLLSDTYQGKSFKLLSWRTLFCVVLILAVVEVAPTVVFLSLDPSSFGDIFYHVYRILAWIGSPVIIVLFARNKLHAALSVCLFLIFSEVIALDPLRGMEPSGWLTAAFGASSVLIWVLPLILLSVAPAKAVTRRLIFLALGLILLIAFNELSKLGLDLTAPKLQG